MTLLLNTGFQSTGNFCRLFQGASNIGNVKRVAGNAGQVTALVLYSSSLKPGKWE
jgi:hypothetical protein